MATAAPFQVHCPSCETGFPIDPRKVPEDGIHAICSECRRVFHVASPGEGAWRGEASRDDAASVSLETVEAPEENRPEPVVEETEHVPPEAPVEVEPPAEVERDPDAEAEPESTQEAESAPAPEPHAAPVGVEGAALSQGVARFGRRDPHDRARHLARVLVSDMITYHPARYESALEAGTLKEDFADEVEKSWDEYREQVGPEIAEGTDYFVRALNEILAGGSEVYAGTGRPS